MSDRETGTLKFFDGSKGFGFIERERGDDVFLHIQGGFREEDRPDSNQLEGGVRLEFTVVHTEKGPQAKGAQVIGGTESETSSGTRRRGSSPFQVPKDTAPLFEAHRKKTRNLALRLEKAVPFDNGETPDIPNDFSFSQFDKNRIQRRHDAHLAAIRRRPGVVVESVSASVDWRLAVGLGRASVYENGITLDAVDGIPYVPGSGVKGALRTFLVNAVYRPELGDPTDENGQAEKRAFQDPLFCALFGTPADEDTRNDAAERGRVTFHEAYPSDVPTVETDIMNPHYQDYYQGTAAPTDDMDPTIITFPTVREASFTFSLSTRERAAPSTGSLLEATPEESSGSLLDVATHWLRRLLTERGLGAKTSAGYGFFVLEEPT